MPVQLRRDLLAGEVRALQPVGRFEFDNGFDRAARPAQLVAVHVPRVRNLRRLRAENEAACASASAMRPAFSAACAR